MVYFVGAGPGAVDLITVRGERLLKDADIIIYAGSLVNPALLSLAKQNCRCYNSAEMTLEEVVAVMIEGEKKNQLVVRLHTGDPSIYGAIKEQMDQLEKRHIAYEVVPGVSSFCGAAAALKREYTLPNVSQSVIITRIKGRTSVPEKEEIALLAAHQASMVIFLSAGMLSEVAQRLMAGGYSADTPAALVYKATWPDEQILQSTIAELPLMAAERQITKTALILVGNFLKDDYTRSKLYDPTFAHGFRGIRQ